jgi:hypothetical protein
MKQCKTCNQVLGSSKFNKHPTNADRLQRSCRKCEKKRHKEYYQKHLEEERKKKLIWQENNRELHNKHVRAYYERKKVQ